VGKSRREQENHKLHRKCSVKWMKDGNIRTSTLTKTGRTRVGCGTNWKEPQIMPKRNILRTYLMRLWNFKE
jgi:hypothetical protein